MTNCSHTRDPSIIVQHSSRQARYQVANHALLINDSHRALGDERRTTTSIQCTANGPFFPHFRPSNRQCVRFSDHLSTHILSSTPVFSLDLIHGQLRCAPPPPTILSNMPTDIVARPIAGTTIPTKSIPISRHSGAAVGHSNPFYDPQHTYHGDGTLFAPSRHTPTSPGSHYLGRSPNELLNIRRARKNSGPDRTGSPSLSGFHVSTNAQVPGDNRDPLNRFSLSVSLSPFGAARWTRTRPIWTTYTSTRRTTPTTSTSRSAASRAAPPSTSARSTAMRSATTSSTPARTPPRWIGSASTTPRSRATSPKRWAAAVVSVPPDRCRASAHRKPRCSAC